MRGGRHRNQQRANGRVRLRREPPGEKHRRDCLAENVREVAERVERYGEREELHCRNAQHARDAERSPERTDQHRRRNQGGECRPPPHQRHPLDARAVERQQRRVEGDAVGEVKRLHVLRFARWEPLAAPQSFELVGVEQGVAHHHARVHRRDHLHGRGERHGRKRAARDRRSLAAHPDGDEGGERSTGGDLGACGPGVGGADQPVAPDGGGLDNDAAHCPHRGCRW